MNILFYIETIFPSGAAWSTRANSFIKIFSMLGYNVHVISQYKSKEYDKRIKHFFLESTTVEFIKTDYSRFDRFWINAIALNKIKNHIKKNNIDIVLTTRSPQIFKNLLSFTKKRDIKYYVEQCEWFDSNTFLLKQYSPYYIQLNKRIKVDYKKSSGIIAISSYLENYYKKQGARVIRIPAIIDVTDYVDKFSIDSKTIRLVFAGSIGGKKELLKPIFRALDATKNKLKKKIVFDIIGPTKKQILDNINLDYDLINSLDDIINIHGKVEQCKVQNYLTDAHFLIFLRPQRRSSDAGFPTKVVESFASCTPVITNVTSDLGKYIINDVNGYIVGIKQNDKSLESIFQTITSLSDEEIIEMRKNAKQTATRYFDYRVYAESFKSFLESE